MNKTCIITGATNGIGRATVLKILQEGEFANIAIIGRNDEELRKCCADNCDKTILPVKLDLENLDEIPDIVEKIIKKFKRIDVLLNIAGYTEPAGLLDTTLENFEHTYKINVFAPFLLMKECVKYMKNISGVKKILNVASTAGVTPRPGWLSYASSKASIISMSQTLSVELASYNIKVYCVSPGRCATNLRKKLAPNEDPSSIMQPEDVAEIIVNLISNDEKCLDGQNIVIRKSVQ